jgi:uncharacterized phage-associated protein
MNRYITNEKIGNILAYIAEKCEPLYLTKALKLLYLVDERSFEKSGAPITWLTYNVWEMGPVPSDIYNELRSRSEPEVLFDKNISLGRYVSTETIKNKYVENGLKISPVATFDDLEFSDYELGIIYEVIESYGKLPVNDLIKHVHRDGGLWKKKVVDNDLQRTLFDEGIRTSEHFIDFTELIKDDEYKFGNYLTAKMSNEKHIDLIQQAFVNGRNSK